MDTITPRHQWTKGGTEVLIAKWVGKDGKAYGGFKHPLKVGEVVTASDWNENQECGGGIHGWPWCFSLGQGKEADFTAHWLVYGVDPKDIIDLGGKVKFRTGIVRYSGDWHGAMLFVLDGQTSWVRYASRGAATASGDNGAATASGLRGAATASGDSGAATASGSRGAATASGDRGAATASGKALSAVVTGVSGKARAPEFGCIALAWWNTAKERHEMRCAMIGKREGQLKPDTWYRLDDDGKFVEAAN
jgi:hypothetical protein